MQASFTPEVEFMAVKTPADERSTEQQAHSLAG
jgi:hypothetical protein